METNSVFTQALHILRRRRRRLSNDGLLDQARQYLGEQFTQTPKRSNDEVLDQGSDGERFTLMLAPSRTLIPAATHTSTIILVFTVILILPLKHSYPYSLSFLKLINLTETIILVFTVILILTLKHSYPYSLSFPEIINLTETLILSPTTSNRDHLRHEVHEPDSDDDQWQDRRRLQSATGVSVAFDIEVDTTSATNAGVGDGTATGLFSVVASDLSTDVSSGSVATALNSQSSFSGLDTSYTNSNYDSNAVTYSAASGAT